jgi:SAM-dependent methyltransferase
MSDASDDSLGIRKLGHRVFVGGNGDLWQRIGQLQFDFLHSRGLQPDHTVLDFACGSLRAGLHLVPYLEAGNYLGFDKSFDLIALGIAEELGVPTFLEKRPQFVVNSRFDLSELPKRPDFAIAQSIFTHLTPADTRRAFSAISAISAPHTQLFATFFLREPDSPPNPPDSHSRLCFYYGTEEMRAFGTSSGWRMEYIGNWGHPRNQVMCRFTRETSHC